MATPPTASEALNDTITTLQTSGGMSWETMLLIGLSVVVVLFLGWFFFFRSTGTD